MLIFSGTSNKLLAKKIALKLKIPLGKVEIVHFKNSEARVRIEEDVRNKVCVVIQSTSNPADENLMEMFFMIDALKRSAAKRLVLVIPYFGYARQDQQHRKKECVSAHVIAKFIETLGVDELITMDLHEEQIASFFDIPVTHLSALPILAKAIKNYKKITHVFDKFVIVSPDQGGIERARKFMGERIVIIEKKRDLNKMHVSYAVQVIGDVKGKTAIIVDDIITSGGTAIHASEALQKAGAKKIILAVTHADFIPGTIKKLKNSKIEKIFITDTINLSYKNKFSKLEIISISQVLKEVIEKL